MTSKMLEVRCREIGALAQRLPGGTSPHRAVFWSPPSACNKTALFAFSQSRELLPRGTRSSASASQLLSCPPPGVGGGWGRGVWVLTRCCTPTGLDHGPASPGGERDPLSAFFWKKSRPIVTKAAHKNSEPTSGQSGYITPATWGVPTASERGAESEVAHKSAREPKDPARNEFCDLNPCPRPTTSCPSIYTPKRSALRGDHCEVHVVSTTNSQRFKGRLSDILHPPPVRITPLSKPA